MGIMCSQGPTEAGCTAVSGSGWDLKLKDNMIVQGNFC